MTRLEAIAAIEGRLAGGFGECPIRPYASGDYSIPQDLSAFVTIDFPVMNEGQISIGVPGGNIFRVEGGFRVVIHWPRDQARSTAIGWVDQIQTLFRGRQFSGITTYAPDGPILDDASDARGYIELVTVVPFVFDLTG